MNYAFKQTTLLMLMLVVLTGCASVAKNPENPPLSQYITKSTLPTRDAPADKGVILVVSFSGGGNRAAAFSYGVLEELHETHLPAGHDKLTLAEEIDMISAVSGGSITAAYYGIHGASTFDTFRENYLEKDTTEGIKSMVFSFSSLSRLGSETFGSGELLEEYFRQQLFGETMLKELVDNQGPYVQINATDLFKGGRFAFNAEQFALICSDVAQFPVARAVAASSSVPILFSPITLINRAGQCGFPTPEWIESGLLESETNPRLYRLAKYQNLYLDSRNRPYIHLQDGGLADNLGLRATMDRIISNGGLWNTLKRFNQKRVKHIVIVSVDASALPPSEWEKTDKDPSTVVVIDAATTAPLSNYNFETLEYLRSHIPLWQSNVRSGRCIEIGQCDEPNIYLVDLRLEDVPDEVIRTRLTSVPTDLNLPPGTLDSLIEAGRQQLKNHPEFRRLLKGLAIQ